VPGLCERVCALVAGSSAPTLVCELGSSVRADAVAVETLARVQLTVRRLGRRVQLRHASRELQELLAFLGLDEALRVEPGRQAEQREESLGVEEEGELDDPPV
jgi:ABC-type transporter Mla MlaB component